MQQVIKHQTRSQLLSLIPTGGKVAEIGVFKGDFSNEILQICHPTELVLFDLWPDGLVDSGDADGNNPQVCQGADLEKAVRLRFGRSSQVHIFKGCSSRIREFPANYFDAIYVDGDHTHKGVMRDLVNSWRCLKHGGWLMGHDYESNSDKTDISYNFGVKDSVDEFCWQFGECIHAFGMDGQVSYAIQVTKKNRLFHGRLYRMGIHFLRFLKRFQRKIQRSF
jgi:hypothetical protein